MRTISVCFLILILIITGGAYGQSGPDSLIALAELELGRNYRNAYTLAELAQKAGENEKNLALRVRSAAVLGHVRAKTNRTSEAIEELNKLLSLVLKQRDPGLHARLFAATGVAWACHENYDSAQRWFKLALDSAQVASDSVTAGYVTIALGAISIKRGSPQAAARYYDQGLAIFSRLRHPEGLARAQHLNADIFFAQRLYDQALSMSRESRFSFEALNHLQGLAESYLREGNVFFMKSNNDSAQRAYARALELFSSIGDSNRIAACYSNLSRLCLETGRANEALTYANRALQSIVSGNYPVTESAIFQQLGDTYAELGDLRRAISAIEEALATARAADHKVIIRDCHKSLSEIYQFMNRPGAAYDHLLAAYRIKDSIQPLMFSARLAEMEAKYEAEKRNAEITALKQQKQISSLKLQQQAWTLDRQRYLIAIMALVAIAVAVVAYYYNSRQKLREHMRRQEAIRETEEKERERIAKDIHDELGSGLSKIRFLAELAGSQATAQSSPVAGAPQLSQSLLSISETSRSLVENMRDLVWAMNPENTTLGNLLARIREYSYEYFEELPLNIHFDFPDNIPEQRIAKEVNRNVYMIVKETLQNIVKHADATDVTIRISLEPLFRLEITDNGKGFDVMTASSGNGLKNIQARSRALGAILNMTSQPGKGSGLALEFRLDMLI